MDVLFPREVNTLLTATEATYQHIIVPHSSPFAGKALITPLPHLLTQHEYLSGTKHVFCTIKPS